MHLESDVSAGLPPTVTVADPGVHGAAVDGVHGAVPLGFLVAGLVGEEHVPNGRMFVIGTWSCTVAISWLADWFGAPAGISVSVPGADPNWHLIIAPITTTSANPTSRAPR